MKPLHIILLSTAIISADPIQNNTQRDAYTASITILQTKCDKQSNAIANIRNQSIQIRENLSKKRELRREEKNKISKIDTRNKTLELRELTNQIREAKQEKYTKPKPIDTRNASLYHRNIASMVY